MVAESSDFWLLTLVYAWGHRHSMAIVVLFVEVLSLQALGYLPIGIKPLRRKVELGL